MLRNPNGSAYWKGVGTSIGQQMAKKQPQTDATFGQRYADTFNRPLPGVAGRARTSMDPKWKQTLSNITAGQTANNVAAQ